MYQSICKLVLFTHKCFCLSCLHLQAVSQWAVVSGCCRDASRSPTRSRRGRNVAYFRWPGELKSQEVHSDCSCTMRNVLFFLNQDGPVQSCTTKEEGSTPRWSHIHTEKADWMVNIRHISAVNDFLFKTDKKRIQAGVLYTYSCITCLSSFFCSFLSG